MFCLQTDVLSASAVNRAQSTTQEMNSTYHSTSQCFICQYYEVRKAHKMNGVIAGSHKDRIPQSWPPIVNNNKLLTNLCEKRKHTNSPKEMAAFDSYFGKCFGGGIGLEVIPFSATNP